MTPIVKHYVYVRYDDPSDVERPYDPRFPEVAKRVIRLISDRLSDAAPEHIGSTAVPGCAGKGVIDLMIPYPDELISEIRSTLEDLGFSEHIGREPFPPDRPVYVGMIDHDGGPFRLHVHAISEDSSEIEEQRIFRDRLRRSSELVAEYVASKRASIAAGPTDGVDYNQGKETFIRKVIEGLPRSTFDRL